MEQPVSSWGECPIRSDEPQRFELGTLRAEVTRRADEWTARCRYETDGESQGPETVSRLVSAGPTPDHVTFTPALATRNVMARLGEAIRLPAGAGATIYVTTPVWVRCLVGDGAVLFDLPVEVHSLAWFGPSTTRGELCVSEDTRGRLLIDSMKERQDRIITPVTVANDGADELTITRLNIPAQVLPVFRAEASGLLWTSKLTIRREKELDLAEVKVGDAAPAQAGATEPLGSPRGKGKRSRMQLAVDLLFA